ncbi:MAG: tripartite tricarboxylate transporter substrate binding protein [Betaproteobacteria bacterium]
MFCCAGAHAQNYPAKPIRYIIPSTGGTEVIARLVAQGMSQHLGQQIVVDPRTGANGNLGAEIAAKAPADGYTLLQITQSHTFNTSYFKKLAFDLVQDFTPITLTDMSPMIVVVHPSFPAKTVADLVRIAKVKPGAVFYGSAGVGTSTYLAAELFKASANINLTEVPYRGGAPSLTAVIAGEVPLYFSPVATGVPLVQQGRLRALAVSTLKRLPAYPEIPTVAESGYPGFEASNWHGLVAPARTPPEIIAILNAAVVSGLKRPEIASRVRELGYAIVAGTPAEFADFIRTDIEKWRRIVQDKNLSAE